MHFLSAVAEVRSRTGVAEYKIANRTCSYEGKCPFFHLPFPISISSSLFLPVPRNLPTELHLFIVIRYRSHDSYGNAMGVHCTYELARFSYLRRCHGNHVIYIREAQHKSGATAHEISVFRTQPNWRKLQPIGSGGAEVFKKVKRMALLYSTLTQTGQQLTVTASSATIVSKNYLQLNVPPASTCPKVKSIQFNCSSHDQGYASTPGTASYSWEISLYSQATVLKFTGSPELTPMLLPIRISKSTRGVMENKMNWSKSVHQGTFWSWC